MRDSGLGIERPRSGTGALDRGGDGLEIRRLEREACRREPSLHLFRGAGADDGARGQASTQAIAIALTVV